MKKYIFAIIFVLCTSVLMAADPQVDTYVNMESGTSGTVLTDAIANTGKYGAGSLTIVGTGIQVTTVGEKALRGPIKVVGINGMFSDTGATRSWRIPDKSANQYVKLSFASTPTVVFSGYITPGLVPGQYSRTDYIVLDGTATGLGFAVFQLENTAGVYKFWIENYNTGAIHSEGIPVKQGVTYWFTMRCNGSTGLCELAIYDTATWKLLAPGIVTSTIPSNRRSNFTWIKAGQAGNHDISNLSVTYSYLDDFCVSRSDTTFPFLPSLGTNIVVPVITNVVPTAIAPSISVQPVGVVTSTDDGFNLNVVAKGDEPLTYQWRFYGNAIGLATNSTYGKIPATTNASGTYSVVVSNKAGSVMSTSVNVSITNPIVIPPDVEGPNLVIASPTNEFDTVIVNSVTFSGTAADVSGVAKITATNLTTGVVITITGTTNWTGTVTGLALGLNHLSVTATDIKNHTSTSTIYINYQYRNRKRSWNLKPSWSESLIKPPAVKEYTNVLSL